jgi:hypothetical protein
LSALKKPRFSGIFFDFPREEGTLRNRRLEVRALSGVLSEVFCLLPGLSGLARFHRRESAEFRLVAAFRAVAFLLCGQLSGISGATRFLRRARAQFPEKFGGRGSPALTVNARAV